MIPSYCFHKLEWLHDILPCLRKAQNIVSQTKDQLETVRDQLKECHKEIMRVKIKNPNDRPVVDIQYPEGYEGQAF